MADLSHLVTGVILAGGKNTRFYSEKSLIEIGNQSLIEIEIAMLKQFFKELMIVTEKEILKQKCPDIAHSEDYFKNCGPLAGIHSALLNSKTDWIFVFACDMPNLNEALIFKQLDLIRSSSVLRASCTQKNDPFMAVIPRHIEGIEPLHGLYHKACLPFIESMLKNQNYSIHGFTDKIRVNWFNVQPDDIVYFYNINTLHDLIQFKSKLS